MKNSAPFYFKLSLLLAGVVLIIISAFVPVKSYYLNDVFINKSSNGLQLVTWNFLVWSTVIIFPISCISNRLINQILVYIFLSIFAVIFLILSLSDLITMGPKTTPIPHYDFGYVLMCLGGAMILTATIISVNRKTKSVASLENSDLLDN